MAHLGCTAAIDSQGWACHLSRRSSVVFPVRARETSFPAAALPPSSSSSSVSHALRTAAGCFAARRPRPAWHFAVGASRGSTCRSSNGVAWATTDDDTGSTSAESWEVDGGLQLRGEVEVSGSKNAALVLMAASLLCSEPVHLRRVPDLADVRSMAAVLRSTGASVAASPSSRSNSSNISGGITLEINSRDITSVAPDPAAVGSLRAGFLVLGPLLAREGRAEVALPGGCRIGARPVDLHLGGLRELGAQVCSSEGSVLATGRLRGADIRLRFPSVGATECLVMAAALSAGEVSLIRNAAMEPEIVALADFLNAMGARIGGAGTSIITVEGVKELHGGEFSVIPDRIEAGTLAVAAACVPGSELLLSPVVPRHMEAPVEALRRLGCRVDLMSGGSMSSDGDYQQEGSMLVAAPPQGKGLLRATDIETAPFPGFPTDLQPQFTTLLAIADGRSVVAEHLFEGRFRHAEALRRMGADVSEGEVQPGSSSLCVLGRRRLTGCSVEATDLRCGAALVLAGLAAEGVTTIHEPWHIDRGYERLDEKLSGVGASVCRVSVNQGSSPVCLPHRAT